MSEEIKTAFETTDEPYFKDVHTIKVNNLGLLDKEILIDTESKDLGLFWAQKERILYIILGLLSLFFLSVLFAGGFFDWLNMI